MRSALQLYACLVLLSAAAATLVEDQGSGLQRCPSLAYDGHRLRCFLQGEARIVQPPIAMILTAESRVRPDPFGNGFYLLVPLQITHDIKLPHTAETKWHVLNVQRFKVEFREPSCPTKCPAVTVSSEWRQGDQPVVRFRCDTHLGCQRLLRALRFHGERSRSLRSSLRFTFYGQANGVQYAMSRVGLPVANALSRPLKNEFWFEGDKLILFTIKAAIGLPAFETYQSEQNYPIPCDGSLPDVYRSNLIDDLANAASTANWEIVAEMRKGGRAVAQAVFKAYPSGLNKDSWFSPERLISTKPFWTGHTGFNFFSIAGHTDNVNFKRRFFINKNYGGCPADFGLFVVSDNRDVCPWAQQFFGSGKAPALIYSTVEAPYQSGIAQMADNFLIYLRLARPTATPSHPLPGAFEFEKNKILLFSVAGNSNNAAADTFLNSAIKHAVPADGKVPALYRSELIDGISSIFARTGKHFIVAEMRANNRMVSQVVFDISSRRAILNKENWFVRDRVVSSYPYHVGDGFNFFSIRGDATWKRDFFISFVYAGCPGDRAFWIVSDARDPCLWGYRHWSSAPALIYTGDNNRGGATLEGGAAKYDANQFLIYVM